MNAKKTLLIGLAMCLSFTAILSFMLVLAAPAPRAKKSKRQRTVASQPADRSTPDRSAPDRMALKQALERRKAERFEKKAAKAKPPPAPAQTEAVPAAPAKNEVDPVAVQHIQLLKRDLQQRVDALEKNRSKLVSQLADQLTDMSATHAAVQIRALDDEAATRVLAHLSTPQRDPILKELAPKRAQRLSRSLASRKSN